MKKIFFFIIIPVFLISIFSCEKKEVEEAAQIVATASMTATVNDTAWSSITRVTKIFPTVNNFVIIGTDIDGKVLTLTVRGTTKGTYTSSTSIDSLSAQVGAIWKPDTTEYYSKKGTVILSDVNTTEKRISGTFNFEVIPNVTSGIIEVKSGKFSNLKYQESED